MVVSDAGTAVANDASPLLLDSASSERPVNTPDAASDASATTSDRFAPALDSSSDSNVAPPARDAQLPLGDSGIPRCSSTTWLGCTSRRTDYVMRVADPTSISLATNDLSEMALAVWDTFGLSRFLITDDGTIGDRAPTQLPRQSNQIGGDIVGRGSSFSLVWTTWDAAMSAGWIYHANSVAGSWLDQLSMTTVASVTERTRAHLGVEGETTRVLAFGSDQLLGRARTSGADHWTQIGSVNYHSAGSPGAYTMVPSQDGTMLFAAAFGGDSSVRIRRFGGDNTTVDLLTLAPSSGSVVVMDAARHEDRIAVAFISRNDHVATLYVATIDASLDIATKDLQTLFTESNMPRSRTDRQVSIAFDSGGGLHLVAAMYNGVVETVYYFDQQARGFGWTRETVGTHGVLLPHPLGISADPRRMPVIAWVCNNTEVCLTRVR